MNRRGVRLFFFIMHARSCEGRYDEDDGKRIFFRLCSIHQACLLDDEQIARLDFW